MRGSRSAVQCLTCMTKKKKKKKREIDRWQSGMDDDDDDAVALEVERLMRKQILIFRCLLHVILARQNRLLRKRLTFDWGFPMISVCVVICTRSRPKSGGSALQK